MATFRFPTAKVALWQSIIDDGCSRKEEEHYDSLIEEELEQANLQQVLVSDKFGDQVLRYVEFDYTSA